jgi:hypothetical protein
MLNYIKPIVPFISRRTQYKKKYSTMNFLPNNDPNNDYPFLFLIILGSYFTYKNYK